MGPKLKLPPFFAHDSVEKSLEKQRKVWQYFSNSNDFGTETDFFGSSSLASAALGAFARNSHWLNTRNSGVIDENKRKQFMFEYMLTRLVEDILGRDFWEYYNKVYGIHLTKTEKLLAGVPPRTFEVDARDGHMDYFRYGQDLGDDLLFGRTGDDDQVAKDVSNAIWYGMSFSRLWKNPPGAGLTADQRGRLFLRVNIFFQRHLLEPLAKVNRFEFFRDDLLLLAGIAIKLSNQFAFAPSRQVASNSETRDWPRECYVAFSRKTLNPLREKLFSLLEQESSSEVLVVGAMTPGSAALMRKVLQNLLLYSFSPLIESCGGAEVSLHTAARRCGKAAAEAPLIAGDRVEEIDGEERRRGHVADISFDVDHGGVDEVVNQIYRTYPFREQSIEDEDHEQVEHLHVVFDTGAEATNPKTHYRRIPEQPVIFAVLDEEKAAARKFSVQWLPALSHTASPPESLESPPGHPLAAFSVRFRLELEVLLERVRALWAAGPPAASAGAAGGGEGSMPFDKCVFGEEGTSLTSTKSGVATTSMSLRGVHDFLQVEGLEAQVVLSSGSSSLSVKPLSKLKPDDLARAIPWALCGIDSIPPNTKVTSYRELPGMFIVASSRGDEGPGAPFAELYWVANLGRTG